MWNLHASARATPASLRQLKTAPALSKPCKAEQHILAATDADWSMPDHDISAGAIGRTRQNRSSNRQQHQSNPYHLTTFSKFA